MNNIETLCAEWSALKKLEKEAAESRRAVEYQLIRLLGVIESQEGTNNFIESNYSIKVVNRFNKKVDHEKVLTIAQESGLTEYVNFLFRWKAEVDSRAWKTTSNNISETFLPAITTTPGRPTFTIEKKEQENDR